MYLGVFIIAALKRNEKWKFYIFQLFQTTYCKSPHGFRRRFGPLEHVSWHLGITVLSSLNLQNEMQKSKKIGFTCFNLVFCGPYFVFRYSNFLLLFSKLLILPLIRTRFLYWISSPFCYLKLKLKAGKFTILHMLFFFDSNAVGLRLSKLGVVSSNINIDVSEEKSSNRRDFMVVHRRLLLQNYARFIFTIKRLCFEYVFSKII